MLLQKCGRWTGDTKYVLTSPEVILRVALISHKKTWTPQDLIGVKRGYNEHGGRKKDWGGKQNHDDVRGE